MTLAASGNLKAEGASFWDANPCGGRWTTFGEWEAFLRRAEPYTFEALEARDWNGRVVLDAGCGQGPFSRLLTKLGATVVAIDRSRGSLMRAKAAIEALGTPARLANADAENLPFADAVFDGVISLGVLHHTPDTAGGIREIARVLKSGGLALVMLYRRGNPKWYAVAALRALARGVDRIAGRRAVILTRLRRGAPANAASGTALIELFGVPTMKAFTNAEALSMFTSFERASVCNRYPGFARLPDIVPALRWAARPLHSLDEKLHGPCGFYQFITAVKRR